MSMGVNFPVVKWSAVCKKFVTIGKIDLVDTLIAVDVFFFYVPTAERVG
jgi:hypothetical protein